MSADASIKIHHNHPKDTTKEFRSSEVAGVQDAIVERAAR
jgi:hypothetical protein